MTAVADAAGALQQDYLETLRAGVRAHPRSHQKMIGPSELGEPCIRALLNRLGGVREPEGFEPAWIPAVGTALHTQVQVWFDHRSGTEECLGRWETEQRVVVGTIGGQEISGSTDLWDDWLHAVVDHKFVGKAKLRAVRVNRTPGPKYRAQAHLYGKGWEDAGKRVDLVMLAFVPRSEGTATLGDTVFWWEPYDRGIAEAALERANKLYDLIAAVGLPAALGAYPNRCDDEWCRFCHPPANPAPPAKPFTA
jgi:hypothetical protein